MGQKKKEKGIKTVKALQVKFGRMVMLKMSSTTKDNYFGVFYKKALESICYIPLISGTTSTSYFSHISNNNLYPAS